MFDDSFFPYHDDYIGDGVYDQDRPPPKETLFDIIDRTWSQLEQEFESCRRGFDRSPVTQDNRPGEGGHRLGYVQQLPRHAPLHPVSAISQLDDIFPLCHEQCIPTTVQPEHLQFDLVPARTPEHASSTTHNIPFRLEARLPSSDTDTLAPWDTQYAVLDAPNADMYYESLQAPRYGEHSAGRPTQRAIEFARQPEPGVCFGDTLDHPADVAAASVRSDNPFAHSTWTMPLKAESSFDECSTQSPPSPSPYPPSVPAASSPLRTRYNSPMNSLDFGAPQHMPEAAMPQAVRRPLEASILNTSVSSDGQTPPAVACSSSLGGPDRAPIVAPPSRLDATHNNLF